MTEPKKHAREEGYTPDWSNVARPRGLGILIGIVALGLLPAAYLAYEKASPSLARTEEQRAALATVEGRLAIWHEFGGPMIHNRIATFARASAEHPWIITHQIQRDDGGPPEVWGIDTEELPSSISRLEGSKVIVELPAPRLLGRTHVPVPDGRKLPTYGPDDRVGDADERLEQLALWFLEKLPTALARDIEGASLEIRVDG
ncbi:MAG: hypothetical protein WD226_07065 [Planctomycetota bacterium]